MPPKAPRTKLPVDAVLVGAHQEVGHGVASDVAGAQGHLVDGVGAAVAGEDDVRGAGVVGAGGVQGSEEDVAVGGGEATAADEDLGDTVLVQVADAVHGLAEEGAVGAVLAELHVGVGKAL